jgi:photosystem II stability/assembly factor-like uncharacterized protein
MIGSDTVYIAAAYGEIGKTVDGGLTMSALYSGTKNSLFAVSFVNGQLGWVAGDSGFIAKTTDGGITWQQQTTGVTDRIYDIQFVDVNNGFAVTDSGDFLKTGDGGSAWIFGATPPATSLRTVFFLTPDVGWAGGSGTIAKTTDGGSSWAEQQPNRTIWSIYFIDADTGWAIEQFAALYTTCDGGTTWNLEQDLDTYLFHGSDIHFYNSQIGWAAGSYQVSGTNFDGRVLRTNDGGVTWTQLKQFRGWGLHTVAFSGPDTGWCGGNDGELHMSIDTGSTWTDAVQGPAGTLYSVFFVDEDNGWAVGGSNFDSSEILHTTNGGAKWEQQTGEVNNRRFKSVFFTTVSTGYIAGDETIMKTTDAGANWLSQTAPNYDYNCVMFSDASNGWAVAGNSLAVSAVVRTQDGGASWSSVSTGFSTIFNGVWFFNPDTGIVVGASGTILRTTNAGATWSSVGDSSFGTLNDVHFTDTDNGWVTGTDNILGTTDGGLTWQYLFDEDTYNLAHSFFVNSDTGYAVAISNTTPFPAYILKTIDGGLNWQREPLDAAGMFGAGGIFFVNSQKGWVVSSGGTIMHTANGGGIVWSLPEVRVTSPAGGEDWETLTDHDITWTAKDSDGFASRSIWLSIDNGISFTCIDSAAGNTGSFTWNVQSDTATGSCIIEIRVVDNLGYMGKQRSNTFTISGIPISVLPYNSIDRRPEARIISVNHLNSIKEISFFLRDKLPSSLSIYNIKGRLLKTLFKGTKPAGMYKIAWDVSTVPSGVYYIKLQAGKTGQAQCLIHLK